MILRRNRRLAGWVGAALCTLSIPAVAAPPLPSPNFFLHQASRSDTRAAREALEEGQRLLSRYEFDRAAEVLHRAVEAMLASSTPADDGLLGEALVDLAVAYTRAGQRDRSRETLMELGRLVPDHVVDANLYPSVFLREVEEARLALDKGPRGTLVLRGPDGARVDVDGRSLGALPTEASLPVGRHRIKLGDTQRLVKLGARGGALDLSRGSTASVSAPIAKAKPTPQASEDTSWEKWSEDDAAPTPPPEDAPGTRSLPGIEAVTEERRPEAPRSGTVQGGPPWWVWTLVGVGVAAAAGGTVLGVKNAMGAPPLNTPAQTP